MMLKIKPLQNLSITMGNSNQNTQEKVVFLIDPKVNNKVLPISDSTFNYVLKTLEAIMLKNDVSVDNMFIGGSKRSLTIWIANIISLYSMKQLEIENHTIHYIDDSDFDIDK